jgi:hypothetical protein
VAGTWSGATTEIPRSGSSATTAGAGGLASHRPCCGARRIIPGDGLGLHRGSVSAFFGPAAPRVARPSSCHACLVCREIEAAGPEATWTCGKLRVGATCRTSTNDWGRAVRAQAARRIREERGAAGVAQLATRFVPPRPWAVAALAAQMPPQVRLAIAALQLLMQQPAATGAPCAAPRPGLELPSAWAEPAAAAFPPAQPAVLCPPAPPANRRAAATWHCHQPPPSSLFSEFVPGRDELLPAAQLVAGLDAYDAGGGEHILSTAPLPRVAFSLASPLVLAGLRMFQDKLLPECAEGRCARACAPRLVCPRLPHLSPPHPAPAA